MVELMILENETIEDDPKNCGSPDAELMQSIATPRSSLHKSGNVHL